MIELVAGAMLGAAFVALARGRGRGRGRLAEAQIYAVGLVIAAVIYVGFALFWMAPLPWVAIEASGVPLFALFAWLGLRRSAWWLAVGWLVHPAWDVGLHLAAGTPAFVPSWYPVVCIGFDLLVAGVITVGVRAGRLLREAERRSVAARP